MEVRGGGGGKFHKGGGHIFQGGGGGAYPSRHCAVSAVFMSLKIPFKSCKSRFAVFYQTFESNRLFCLNKLTYTSIIICSIELSIASKSTFDAIRLNKP